MKGHNDTKSQLLRGNFKPSSPQSSIISDPIEPTPMMLSLDQLRPYDKNPRKKKNPNYDDIKESIRARGLDNSPTVSRRPGEAHFIIDNGGNTRLEILNDLWKETKEERFFKIHCLFRPWKGDIKALTGHMSENDQRGNLLWIERCLGVMQSRQLYEQENGQPINQSELTRRLKADGYPVDRTHINRMDQTVQHLFPCIPNILWNGMGHDSVRALLTLRTYAENAWNKLVTEKGVSPTGLDFSQVFSTALQHFDDEPESYVFQHVQDELIGAMTEALRPNGVSYELILHEIEVSRNPNAAVPEYQAPTEEEANPPALLELESEHPTLSVACTETTPVATAAETTEQPRLSIRAAETPPKSHAAPKNTAHVESIPVSVGGLSRVSDIWTIASHHLSPGDLRNQIDLLALEISNWANILEYQTSTKQLKEGIGFRLTRPEQFKSERAEVVWHLLASLTAEHKETIKSDTLEIALIQVLPDDLLIKLFRLIRLVRALRELTRELDHE